MPNLTKKFIDSLRSDGVDRIYFDDQLSRFGLRVKPSGVKSFVLRYRFKGRSQSYALGKYGVLTADEARRRALATLADIDKGLNPSGQRRADRDSPTVKELTEDYLERHARPNKRESSVRNDAAMIEHYILPKIGRIKVSDVNRRDIERIHIGMKPTPYQANRCLSLLSKMFNLAVSWEWRRDNPALRIPKYQEERRERWLSDEELSRLFDALNKAKDQKIANAIRLLVLTGARRGEVLSAKWSEFDLAAGYWNKPSAHTKQKRSHRVPLSESAWELLKHIFAHRDREKEWVFPGRLNKDQPLQDIKKCWAEVIKEARLEGARLHDLRHTFASHLVSSGQSLPIVGRLLGHTQSQTTHRYAHLADQPLRAAANAFGLKTQALKESSVEEEFSDGIRRKHAAA